MSLIEEITALTSVSDTATFELALQKSSWNMQILIYFKHITSLLA